MFKEEYRYQPSEDRLYRRLTQPSRDAVMEAIKTVRNEGAVRKQDVMRWELSIPLIDRELLGIKYPDLNSPDGKIRSAAWKRFIASEESRPYRVRG